MINLIHEQRALVKQREHQIRVLVLCTFGLGAFAFLAAGYYVFEAARYQVMISALESKKAKLSPMLKQLANNERDEKMLEPKLTTLTSATKATEQWSRILDHLTLNCPKEVWLTGVKANPQVDQDGGVGLTFSGYSSNHDAIGEFLLRLEACADLESVSLKFSQERTLEQDKKVLEFEISAYLAGSRKEKKVKEKDSA